MRLFDRFKKKQSSVVKITDEEKKQFDEDMLANANALAKQFENVANLDFTISSLRQLDQIIEENTSFYKDSNDETKRIMIIKIGAYVFEVARQNLGGIYYWYVPLNQPILVTGQPDFEMSLLTYEKVRNRFEKGVANNIPSFFEGYVEGVKNKHTAMII